MKWIVLVMIGVVEISWLFGVILHAVTFWQSASPRMRAKAIYGWLTSIAVASGVACAMGVAAFHLAVVGDTTMAVLLATIVGLAFFTYAAMYVLSRMRRV